MPADADTQRLQREFMALSLPERRAVIRAVNRGQLVAEKKHARFAVVVARRQQRFWRYAWLLGPALAIVQFFLIDPVEAALLNGGLGTVVLAGLARFWYVRAVRAETLNEEVAQRRGGKRRPSGDRRDRDAAAGGRQGRTGGSTASDGATGDAGPWWRRLGRRRGATAATPTSGSGGAGGGHLPGEGPTTRPARPRVADEGDDGADPSMDPAVDPDTPRAPGQRPYRPRGNKRRR